MRETEEIGRMLNQLRKMRDEQRPSGFVRSYYNTACDRLAVLLSKVMEESIKQSRVKLCNTGLFERLRNLDMTLAPENDGEWSVMDYSNKLVWFGKTPEEAVSNAEQGKGNL